MKRIKQILERNNYNIEDILEIKGKGFKIIKKSYGDNKISWFLKKDPKYKSPKKRSKQSKVKERLGMIRKNKQGLDMQIVNYNKAIDINVRFLIDGFEKKTTFQCFNRGSVYHPHYLHQNSLRNERMGEKGKSSEGYELKIVNYNGTLDIDVYCKEKEITIKHRTYSEFIKEIISVDNYVNKNEVEL